MKKILTFAVALLAITGMSISAASLSDQNSDTKKEKTEKKDRKDKKGRPGAKGHGQRLFNPFEGLNLSEEQQKQIGSLTPYINVAPPKSAECCQGEGQACCEGEGQACCKGSSPEQIKDAALAKLNEIKGILTAEQYQQYLENVAVNSIIMTNKGPVKAGMKGDAKSGNGKKDFKGKKGNRGPKGKGEKPVQPQQPQPCAE